MAKKLDMHQTQAVFLKSFWFTCGYLCVSALMALMTSGMIWCDIGRV